VKRLLLITLLILLGCGRPPDSPPTLPTPVEWTGSILIIGTIIAGTDTLSPDSMEVFLDGNSLGWKPHTCDIHDITVGRHALYTSSNHNFVTYRSSVSSVLVEYGFETYYRSQMTPANLKGAILIDANISGGASVDSIDVVLDGVALGNGPNPRLLTDVLEGIHKATISSLHDTARFEGWIRDLQVTAEDTSTASVDLALVAPWVGMHAPDAFGKDLDDHDLALSDHWGKVVYLYFFEHT
jgi:hypothetical protein